MCDDMLPGKDLELGLVLVDESDIRELNSTYRGEERETDVLAFPQLEPGELDELPPGGRGPGETLGDIVICVPVAELQARRVGWSLSEELELLAAHGLLHLLGFEDGTPEQRSQMAELEKKLVGRSIIESDARGV